jgi:hypothetical protein
VHAGGRHLRLPDPTTTPPSNPRDYTQVTDRKGVWLAIPNSIDPQWPLFEQAATACNFGANGCG